MPNRTQTVWRLTMLASALYAGFACPAHANPTGATLVGGAATFSGGGNTLTITNAPGTVINWDGFSINRGEVTHFQQESAASQVLNRVTGANPSMILGSLTSNGRVFVINPNGITFGPGSQVDVAGLVVATLKLSDQNFKDGKLDFEARAGAGKIINQGMIATNAAGGQVLIVAPKIENSGIIRAPDGQILLAAGKRVNLVDIDHPDIQVEIGAPANEAVNLGQMFARDISIYGGIVTNGGRLDADTAVVGTNGRILLDARQNLTTTASSSITADGFDGGNVALQAEQGTALIQGNISAQGQGGRGGSIHVTGKQVGLLEGASLNTDGATAGGEILIGGDAHGSNPNIQNAEATFIAAGAQLHADALGRGNGGKVVVWADGATRDHGQITARGAQQGGNGGWIETSGKRYLEVTATPDAGAPAGQAGTWLLDPHDVTVQASAGTLDGQTPSFNPGADNSTILNTVIETALNNGTSVMIDTGTTGTQAGDITINAAISKTAGATATLTLVSAHNIFVNQSITSTSGNLNLNLNQHIASSGTNFIANGVTIDNNGGTTGFMKGLTLNGTLRNGALVSSDGSLLTGISGKFDGVSLGDANYPVLATTLAGSVFSVGPGGLLVRAGQFVTLDAVTLNGGTFTVNGTLNLNGSSIMSNTANFGNILANGSNLFGGLLSNAGSIAIQSGTTSTTNLTQNAGSLTLGNGASIGALNMLGGTLALNGGILGGTGTIVGNVNVGAATIAPGFSPGAITITGNLNLASASALNIELGGFAQGTGYDYINVLGTANLAGTLNVLSFGGYTPAPGSRYSFMHFAGATGNFSAVNIPGAWGMSLNRLGSALELDVPISMGATFPVLDITQSLAVSTSQPAASVVLADLGLTTEQPIFYERAPTAKAGGCQ